MILHAISGLGKHLVESGHAAVVRQEIADLEAIERQQIFEGVFEFGGGHSPHAGPAVFGDPRGISVDEPRVESGEKGRQLFSRRPRRFCRRHLALRDAVVDADEACHCRGIGKVARRRGEVEAGLGLLARVAVVAVPLEEGFDGRGLGARVRGGGDEHHRGKQRHAVRMRHASSPRSEPVLVANESASMPIRWSIVT